MKQKKISDILYVFDITPYQITEDTDAEVIKVQQEVVAGFKELNESLADKIVAYNYHITCVQVPEWAPYVDEPDPTPKEYPELAWSSNSATVTIGADDNVFPTLSNPNSVSPITYNSTVTGVATVDEYGNITLVSAGTTDIWAIFAGNDTYTEQVVTYRLNVEEAQVQTYGIILSGGHLDATKFTAKINNVVATPVTTEEPEPDDWTYDYGLYQAGTVFDVYPTESASNYEADPDLIWDTDHWTATVSDKDLIRDLAYIESEEQPE